jgi:hypothetical protein
VLDTLSFRRSGNSLLRSQRPYVQGLALVGAALGALLAYLNSVSPLLLTPLAHPADVLVSSIFGAILLPAVLIFRLWLASFSSLLRIFTRLFTVPAIPADTAALLLILLALSGFFGGIAWSQLSVLVWLAPLFLLLGLQLLWQESTVFSGLPAGDFSRLALGALSGIVLVGTALACFDLAGGSFNLLIINSLFLFLLGAFGVLCLQLGDLVAEHWRGKKRSEVRRAKPFPIPVVVKK